MTPYPQNDFLFCFSFCHGYVVSLVGYVFHFCYFVNHFVDISSVSSGSVNSLISCCLRYSNLQTSAKCFISSESWNVNYQAGHLWMGLHFGALQYLQFDSFGLSFVLIPSVFFCLCYIVYGFFFDLSSQFDVSASGEKLFLFLLSFILCCFCSTNFGTSKSYSFNNFSHNFLSVIDVISFDISSSV